MWWLLRNWLLILRWIKCPPVFLYVYSWESRKYERLIFICCLDLCVGNLLFLAPENKEKSKYRELCNRKCLSQWCLCGPGARCGHSWGWGPGLSDGSGSGPGWKEGYGGGEGHEGAWQDSGRAAAAWGSQGSQRSRAGRSVNGTSVVSTAYWYELQVPLHTGLVLGLMWVGHS